MSDKDFRAATEALINWFHSQDIGPADATVMMAKAIGEIIGAYGKTPADRREGIDILRTMMIRKAIRE